MKKLGKYEVLAELGHGAMGVVYRARDPIINRLVALKTITTGVANDPALLQRFYREAQSAGGLHHPNIVTIYDMGTESDTPYIAMELIEGENLEQTIAHRSDLPVSLKLVYAMQACRAFDYAHKRGIVHRDIKPGNIMVNKEGTVKVVDFGIARVLDASKTQTGMLIGTFAYMSPEQYHGEHADERSDIWSFGVLLYELLASRRPFTGETPASLMHSICQQEPEPLTNVLPDFPADLQAIVGRSLQKKPTDRYPTMEDMLVDLEPICKTLQAESVAAMVDKSRKFVEQSQYTEARELLRQALQVEATNPTVRSLLEKVNSELKRILVRPRVQEFVEKGRALLEEGKVTDAKIAAESALQLDSTFEPAQDLQKIVRQELERADLINGWIKSAKQHLAEGLPDDAETFVVRVLELDPGHAQAQALHEQVIVEKSERQKRLRLLERLQYARGLWTRQSYSECVQLLEELEQEYPGDEEVARFLETAREDEAEQRRLALLDCRTLLDARRYEECLAQLSRLHAQFPRDEEIPRLQQETRTDQREQRRLQGLTEARNALAAGRYQESIDGLSTLFEEFPGDTEISDLVRTATEKREQHRCQQGIGKARELLFARSYADCVALLSSLQTDFPNEKEIPKVLDSARRDQAEQLKQQKLIEAKGLLAVESFDEAISILDALAIDFPKDSAVSKLRALVLREQDKHVRSERIQRELDALKKLMAEKRYSEVVSRAKELLTEFPADTSFRRLAEFAVSQQEALEKEQLLRKTLDEAQSLFNSNRFKEAIGIVQIGLKNFPAHPDLLYLYQQAEIQQKKLEVRQQIEERVREIRVKINREKFSEAINLAQQTLVTLGPDTDVTQLLTSAEMEFEAREKKREQARMLETIRTLIESGNLDAANKAIEDALKTNVMQPFDPRIHRLASDIQEAKTRLEGETHVTPTDDAPAVSREYAFTAGSTTPIAPPPETVLPAFASTSQGAAVQPAFVTKAESMPSTEVPAPTNVPVGLPATQAASPAPLPAAEPTPAPALSGSLASPSAKPQESPVWRKPAVLALAVLGIVAVGWFGIRSFSDKPASTLVSQPLKPAANPLEGPQREAINAAGKLIASNDLDGARKQLQAAAAMNGPLTADIQGRIAAIEESLKNPALRQLRRREENLWQQSLKRVSDGQYIEARRGLNEILTLPHGGVHRDDARHYLDIVLPQQVLEKDLLAQAHLDLSQGDFQSARFAAGQLQQNRSDATQLLAEIDQAEIAQLASLESQLNQLKQREDDSALLKLKVLQGKFQSLSSSAGPQSAKAQSDANSVAAALADVQARIQRKAAEAPAAVPAAKPLPVASKSDSAVRAVIQRYAQAFDRRDADTLTKIWPTIGSKYSGYKSSFEAASSIRMRLNVKSVDISSDGTTAVVQALLSQDYTASGQTEVKNTKRSITFQLDKVDADWIITDIDETEVPGT